MVDHNTAIRMNHIALRMSVKSRNIQHIYNIRVFICNGNGIIFKSLIASMRLRASKNKHLVFSGNYCIRYDILPLQDLILQIFLHSKIPGFPCYHLIVAVSRKKIEIQKACLILRFLHIITDLAFTGGVLQILTPHMKISQVLIGQLT